MFLINFELIVVIVRSSFMTLMSDDNKRPKLALQMANQLNAGSRRGCVESEAGRQCLAGVSFLSSADWALNFVCIVVG